MPPLPNIVDEMYRLMDQAQQEHIPLRLIGGLAVRMHSQHIDHLGLRREYPDIDFVVRKDAHRKLTRFFIRNGYQPDQMFNTLNGSRRQIYYDSLSGRHVDVFIGDFHMCHKLPMRDRLQVHPMTVPLAELFLSKSQIVHLNRKDAYDLIALLLDNPVGHSDEGAINAERIARLCAKDWGLYTTTTMNLKRLQDILKNEDLGLETEDVELVMQRIETIQSALNARSKSILWKARDRVGKRLRWYTEVEEVNR